MTRPASPGEIEPLLRSSGCRSEYPHHGWQRRFRMARCESFFAWCPCPCAHAGQGKGFFPPLPRPAGCAHSEIFQVRSAAFGQTAGTFSPLAAVVAAEGVVALCGTSRNVAPGAFHHVAQPRQKQGEYPLRFKKSMACSPLASRSGSPNTAHRRKCCGCPPQLLAHIHHGDGRQRRR